MVTLPSQNGASRYPKRSLRAEARLRISETLKGRATFTTNVFRSSTPISVHSSDDDKEMLDEVKSALSGVGTYFRQATSSAAVPSKPPQLAAHSDDGGQPRIEQASSLSRVGGYFNTQRLMDSL